MVTEKKELEAEDLARKALILEASTKTKDYLDRYIFAENFCKNKNVLDVGCGFGSAYFITPFAHSAAYITGLDADKENVKTAKKLFPGRNISYKNGKYDKIPFEDNIFDVVLAFETIQYLDGGEKLVDELFRVAKKDGMVIISAAAYGGMAYKDKSHKKEYTTTQLLDLCIRRAKNMRFYKQKPMPITEVFDSWFDGDQVILVCKKTL